MAGQDKPARGRAGQAGPWPGRTGRPVAGQDRPARGRAGQVGPWPGRTGRPVAGQDRPARGRAGQAAFLPTARAGGCTPGKPPSCLPQGRGVEYFRSVETRERAPMTHTARASASGPKRDIKFFAKLSFKKAGGVAVRRAPKKAALAGGLLFFLISGAAPDGRPQSGRE